MTNRAQLTGDPIQILTLTLLFGIAVVIAYV